MLMTIAISRVKRVKLLNHKILNSVFNRLRSKCLPTEHHKLFSFVPSLLHRYQFVQTEVQISNRSVQTGVFLDIFRNPLGPPLGPSRPWGAASFMVFSHEILEVHLLRNQLCLSLIARCRAWRLPLPHHHGGRAVAQWIPVVAFRATLPNKNCRIRSNPTRIVDDSGMFLIVLEDCLFSCCLKVYPLVTCTTSLVPSHAPHCAGSLQLPEHEQLFCLHPRMMLLYL